MSQEALQQADGVIAVVRLRGMIKNRGTIEDTMRFMRLTRANHATLVPNDVTHRGMLRKVEHFVTYGEVSQDMVQRLLTERGLAPGGKRLTDDLTKETTGKDLATLAAAIHNGEELFHKLDGVKPLFRLAPARNGLRSVKHHFNAGGDLGYRGNAIEQLLERMI